MAKVTVRLVGKITVDKVAAAEAMAAAILKHWAERTAAGRDADDRPFAAYSPLYRRQLAAIGESTTPDVTRTGALMRSLQLKRIIEKSGKVTVILGAGRGASPSKPRPPPWVFDPKKTPEQQAAALERWRRAPKRTAKPASNSKKLRWLERANKGRPLRHILGVSPGGRLDVIRAIERVPIFKS